MMMMMIKTTKLFRAKIYDQCLIWSYNLSRPAWPSSGNTKNIQNTGCNIKLYKNKWGLILNIASKNSYGYMLLMWGPLMVAQWLRYCATNRKVAGSIPDGVFGIFHCHNPFDRTMALGSAQPLNINEYQEHFLEVKAAGCVRLTILPPSCAVVM
jgi:hypothetical protein